jgi:prefoldin subunit 5
MLALAAILIASAAAASPEKLRALVGEETRAQNEAAAVQKRVDGLDDETQKMLAEYRQMVAEAESMRAYNEQLGAQVPAQTKEIESLQQQLNEIETTQREVVPMIQQMLATLERFVALDLPFLAEERQRRVANLKEMMERADVTVSEKYRRVVEAYQIEMEYGRTLEAYEGRLGVEGDARTVQFLRVGRVALMYQTLDRKETGYWDAQKKAWVVDNGYRHAFAENLKIAMKLGAPDLLIVPVAAPQRVEP